VALNNAKQRERDLQILEMEINLWIYKNWFQQELKNLKRWKH
jgi:hypothetical protein